MNPRQKYLIIAVIILIVLTLWVSGNRETQVAPAALPTNGMMGATEKVPEAPAPAPAPAADMGMPSAEGVAESDTGAAGMEDAAETAAEVDGVPQGAEVTGESAAEPHTTDVPPPDAAGAAN